MKDDVICIQVVNNQDKAHLIKAQLEAEGIYCFLQSDDLGGTHPYLNQINGISIFVSKKDQEKAKELIQ